MFAGSAQGRWHHNDAAKNFGALDDVSCKLYDEVAAPRPLPCFLPFHSALAHAAVSDGDCPPTLPEIWPYASTQKNFFVFLGGSGLGFRDA